MDRAQAPLPVLPLDPKRIPATPDGAAIEAYALVPISFVIEK